MKQLWQPSTTKPVHISKVFPGILESINNAKEGKETPKKSSNWEIVQCSSQGNGYNWQSAKLSSNDREED
jgi:hypothetical protein